MTEEFKRRKIKDHLRDYCTEAFRFYSRWGGRENYVKNLLADLQKEKGPGMCSPTEAAMIHKERILREHIAEIADLEAVEKVLRVCDSFVRQAVEYVYLEKPWEEMEWGDIKRRVHYAEIHIPASERQIYRWLKEARMMFAEERGLRF